MDVFEDKNSSEIPGGAPPGTPPTIQYTGPWFSSQLSLALSIGVVSILLFCYCKIRWPILFASRTKLKGFTPHEEHANQAFYGWILPTLRISEFAILQIVGLDAAVMLNFFRMSFSLFFVLSIFVITIILPINLKIHGSIWGPEEELETEASTISDPPSLSHEGWNWSYLVTGFKPYHSLQLVSTYIFTIITLRFLYQNYRRFIRSRQLYSLNLVHSIPARTVMVRNLPSHLQGERALAVYFENMGLGVESVSTCRQVGSLSRLLSERTHYLLKLEKAWVDYAGNPSTIEGYDPSSSLAARQGETDLESQKPRSSHQGHLTPMSRFFKPKVDTLEYLQRQFDQADDAVKRSRRLSKFRSASTAFVTFEHMSSAQIAAQVITTPYQSRITTVVAPEPRDILWSNMYQSVMEERVRRFLSLVVMFLLLFFWTFPIGYLARLLSFEEIKRAMPRLGAIIESNDRLRAIVQHSFPTFGVIALNASLPFLLEYLAYLQKLRARSWIEYWIMKRYFLFLFINVIFIFLLASTYWQVVQELYLDPGRIPEKLAKALNRGNAKNYFVCYVMLQAVGIMPLQLLNLGVVIPHIFYRLFLTRTPRDFAEINAPPLINYGAIYPQTILVFVITLLYSIIQPLILIFGTLYFGMAYFVYKYKLLFVFYKPYESCGQAWPITFIRAIWGVVVFQLFMTGIFVLEKSFLMAFLLVPLIPFTMWWGWHIDDTFKPLSFHTSLSSICEVQRGEETEDVMRLRIGHPVTWSEGNLNRRRYADQEDSVYVSQDDDKTDYSQPPMSNWYYGVLNLGKRRYGHPALTGVLPKPWLPLKKKILEEKPNSLALTLRSIYSALLRPLQKQPYTRPVSRPSVIIPSGVLPSHSPTTSPTMSMSMSPSPITQDTGFDQTSGSRPVRRMSCDPETGIIVLPDDVDWLQEDDSDNDGSSSVVGGSNEGGSGSSNRKRLNPGFESDVKTGKERHIPPAQPTSTRRATYFHHPERRRSRQETMKDSDSR